MVCMSRVVIAQSTVQSKHCTNGSCYLGFVVVRYQPFFLTISYIVYDDVIKMETFSALLALGVGNSPVTCEFSSQRPVTRSFDVFFDLRLNKRLSKHLQGWCFETPSHPLWRHSNVISQSGGMYDYLSNSKSSQKIWENKSILPLNKQSKTIPYRSCYIIC